MNMDVKFYVKSEDVCDFSVGGAPGPSFCPLGLPGDLVSMRKLMSQKKVSAQSVSEPTVKFHVFGAVVVDHRQQGGAVTRVFHQVLQQGEEGKLSTGEVVPAIPHLWTGMWTVRAARVRGSRLGGQGRTQQSTLHYSIGGSSEVVRNSGLAAGLVTKPGGEPSERY